MTSKTILTLCTAALMAMPLAAQTMNEKPFTIPEVQTWKGGEGLFNPTTQSRIVYAGKDAQGLQVAERFAADYAEMFGVRLNVVQGKPMKGDFVLSIAKQKKAKDEAYAITIGDVVNVSAPTKTGLLWATRTLLQLAHQNAGQTLPKGTIQDAPAYGVRGFMLDCGRKFFPMSYLRNYVKMLSYYKMNTFHIHLNDNGFKQFYQNDWNKTQAAFRLESTTYPGLTARDGHYTKQEFIALQEFADSLGVMIVPEIDVPAHTLAFTKYKPEIGSKEYGADHLDLFHPETYNFLDGLFKEYLEGPNPVFRGPYVHIGTDEYSNKDSVVVEKFRYFTDRYIKYVESFGKKAAIWGQQTHAKGKTPIKVKDVVMDLWSNGYAQPKEMIELGYNVISIPDGQVYIVPRAGYYYDYLNTDFLYNKWTPANVGGVIFEEGHPQILGGKFAVWNDHPNNGVSVQDVHYRFFPAMQTLSTKMWTGAKPTFTYEQFNTKRHNLNEAPGVNVAGRFAPGKVLEKKTLRPGETTTVEQLGWNYSVSYDITYREEDKGTPLFTSGDATFYLADPVSGFIGYSRDGHLYTFGCQLYNGETAKITIAGDKDKTQLFINGKLMGQIDVKKVNFGERGDMYMSGTLVFPLKQAGQFKSQITNFVAESK